MPFPFVSRERYDELKADYKDLLAKYDALKMAGAVLPASKLNQPSSAPSPEAIAAQRMHAEIVDRLASEIATMPGIRRDDALREAQRLKAEALGGGGDGLP